MNIKRYQAPDMRRALKKVSDDLGSEAVILSNRKTANGVELWASVGEDAYSNPVTPKSNGLQQRQNSETSQNSPHSFDSGKGHNLFQAKRSSQPNRSRKELEEGLDRIKKNSKLLLEKELKEFKAGSLQSHSDKERNNRLDSKEDLENIESLNGMDSDAFDQQSVEAWKVEALKNEIASVRQDLHNQSALLSQMIHQMDPLSVEHHPDCQQANNLSQSSLSNKKTQPKQQNQRSSFFQFSSNEKVLLRMGFDSLFRQEPGQLALHHLLPTCWKQLPWSAIESELATKMPLSTSEMWNISGLEDRDSQNIVTETMSNHPVQSRIPKDRLSRCFALVGPTGVGKTSTIGKIASRFILNTHDPSAVALITTDIDRTSSVELLKSYAKQLGCSFHKSVMGKPLRKLLDKLKHKQLVLVDTAGMTSSHQNWEVEKENFLSFRDIIEPVLVLPSTVQLGVLKNIVRDYQSFDCFLTIISKLDESVSLGEVLSTVMKSSLSITYVTDGVSLADDLHRPKADELIKFAKHLGDQGEMPSMLLPHGYVVENAIEESSAV